MHQSRWKAHILFHNSVDFSVLTNFISNTAACSPLWEPKIAKGSPQRCSYHFNSTEESSTLSKYLVVYNMVGIDEIALPLCCMNI